jgi:hypothetical protein
MVSDDESVSLVGQTSQNRMHVMNEVGNQHILARHHGAQGFRDTLCCAVVAISKACGENPNHAPSLLKKITKTNEMAGLERNSSQ